MCNEQCAPANSTTPATPEAIGRVCATAVIPDAAHGGKYGAGPGPAAATNTGGATRNALSATPEPAVDPELNAEVGPTPEADDNDDELDAGDAVDADDAGPVALVLAERADELTLVQPPTIIKTATPMAGQRIAV
jgi:hypothetical protein